MITSAIDRAVRLAFLANLSKRHTIKRHDRQGSETQQLADLCGVDIRTIQRDLLVLNEYNRELKKLKDKYKKELNNA